IDAVGVHGFPGTWECAWEGWDANIGKVRRVLDRHGLSPQVWITETGFSTWRHEERGQLREFSRALDAPVDRVYWASGYDLDPDHSTMEGFHLDERCYHLGLKHTDSTPKLLYRL